MKLDFTLDGVHFRLWNSKPDDIKTAKEEAQAIIDDAKKIKAPYEMRRDYIFKNLVELLEYRR